jgi:hypothetical protein
MTSAAQGTGSEPFVASSSAFEKVLMTSYVLFQSTCGALTQPPFLDACDVQVSNCRFAVIERVFNTGAPALAAARRPKEIDMIFDQRSWTSSTQRLARSAGESMRNADKSGRIAQ